MTDVLLADDQALIRTGLRLILSTADDLTVVGEAADGLEAVALASVLGPDVILMDIRMPGLDGIEATRRITAAHPDIRVAMLTTFDRSQLVYDSLVAGASGFLLKDASGDQLVAEFTRPGRDGPPAGYAQLTEREAEVLGLVARGLSNAEIAARLFVSIQTVKTHVSRMLQKLGLRDRVQAVVLAYEHGLVRPGE